MAVFDLGDDVPFTTADNLNLQRVNQQLAGLSQQVSDGELYPQEAEPEQQLLAQERNALIQRQKQAELAARGQQRMQQQDEMAFQHAATLTNMQQAANQFMTTMPRFENPDTGETTYFYPDGKGGFTPLERGGPSIDETDVGDLSGAVEDRVGPPEPPTAPMPRSSGEPARGGFEQTIQNGPFQTRVQYDDRGRTVGMSGSPQGMPGVRNLQNVDPRIAQAAWERANAAVPGPPSAQRFAQVQQEFTRQIPAVQQEFQEQQAATVWGLSAQQFRFAQAQAAQAVAGMHPRLAQREYPRILNQALRTVSANQRAHSAELAKEQRAQQAAQAKEQAEQQRQLRAADTRFQVEYSRQFGAIQKEIDAWRRKTPEAEVQKFAADPANAAQSYLWDRDAHMAEARSRAEAATLDKHPDWTPPSLREQKPAGGQGGAPAQAPPGVQGGPPAAGAAPGGVQPAGLKAPVPQGTPAPPAGINFPKQPLSAIQEELNRRAQEKQQGPFRRGAPRAPVNFDMSNHPF